MLEQMAFCLDFSLSAIQGLGFDLGLWNCKGKRELINYNAREGKKLFSLREFFSRNVSKK
jgi:hypothetical protein